jgi:hypothetical protein
MPTWEALPLSTHLQSKQRSNQQSRHSADLAVEEVQQGVQGAVPDDTQPSAVVTDSMRSLLQAVHPAAPRSARKQARCGQG